MMNKWLSKCLVGALLATLITPVFQGIGGTKAYAATPANPNATQAVKDVLNYFDTVYTNNQIISGQMVTGDKYGYNEIDRVAELTGKYPAMIGYDFGYKHSYGTLTDLSTERSTIVEQSVDYWKKGGLVQISWHETNPLDTIPDDVGWNSVISSMSQTDFDAMTTPGTPLYTKWLTHVDMIADYLKMMRDQGVVVLWRPYHEMNIGFWWGGKTAASYKKLWQNMYDRYTNYHGLNNLIWVWSPARDDGHAVNNNYYPGSSYVDLGGADVYVQNRSDAKYTNANSELTSVMGSKRYGLSEVGLLPNESAVQTNFDYTWFLIWASNWVDNLFYGFPGANGPGNDPYFTTQFYNHAVTITRDEVPALGRTIDPGTFIFKDTMNTYPAAGGAPTNWLTTATGGAVTVENVPSVGLAGPDRSMKINKTVNTNDTNAKKTIGSQTGVVTFKATLRTEEVSWKDYLIVDSTSKIAVHIGLNNGYLRAYDGTTLTALEPITNGKWYDVKVVLNTTTKKYDVYVGGAKKANQFSFKDTTAVDVNKLAFGVAGSETGILYVDNVRITK
ncbi:glycosyl hydrolase [Paenibacillus qinlingensis]|uniref:Beta-mannanase n=1 Tax=Paenibacillus qinlingensis TaxID=1837343 RepID=A0ABU1NWS2_9BACL|nr:glycosyl hydrolase [Paenibacillus qinlingensis]MDR6551885.1 beta-mannanase [Paenibacillus qinlingensis]